MHSVSYFVLSTLSLCLLVFTGCRSTEEVSTQIDIAGDRLDLGMGNLISRITHIHRDYQFLQETGGILVQAPQLQPDGTYFLPVYADVSGASNITRTPVRYNAEIAVREIGFSADKFDPSRLYVHIKTAYPTKEIASPVTRGRNIGELSGGRYTLEYLNSDGSTVALGGFEIAN